MDLSGQLAQVLRRSAPRSVIAPQALGGGGASTLWHYTPIAFVGYSAVGEAVEKQWDASHLPGAVEVPLVEVDSKVELGRADKSVFRGERDGLSGAHPLSVLHAWVDVHVLCDGAVVVADLDVVRKLIVLRIAAAALVGCPDLEDDAVFHRKNRRSKWNVEVPSVLVSGVVMGGTPEGSLRNRKRSSGRQGNRDFFEMSSFSGERGLVRIRAPRA